MEMAVSKLWTTLKKESKQKLTDDISVRERIDQLKSKEEIVKKVKAKTKRTKKELLQDLFEEKLQLHEGSYWMYRDIYRNRCISFHCHTSPKATAVAFGDVVIVKGNTSVAIKFEMSEIVLQIY